MGVRAPEFDRPEVGLVVEGDAGATLLLPECVPHHGDGGHRGLGGLELGVDAHDAPVRVGDVALGDRLSLALLLELLARVQDEVEPLGLRRLETLEPAGEDRELAGPPRLVAAAEEVGVVGGDGRDPRLGGGGVADEQVLAERRVAVHEHRSRLELPVGQLHQLLRRHPRDAGAGEVGTEVAAEGEGGHVDLAHQELRRICTRHAW